MAENDDQKAELRASARRVERGDDIALSIDLDNTLDRAAHFIADVRAISYDAATRRLEVRLSDEGRQVLPGGMYVEPTFERVDPASSAQLVVHVPRSIVRAVPTDPPSAEVRIEEIEIGPDVEIEVSIGWSDTPFYPDPRERAEGEASVQDWERSKVRVSFAPDGD